MKYAKIASMTSALALAMSLGTTASAQSSSGGAAGGQGGGTTSTSGTFQSWLNQHKSGKITRQQYMDEVGRRWDSADRSKQGLTYDEINHTYFSSAVGMGGPTSTSPQDKKGIKQ